MISSLIIMIIIVCVFFCLMLEFFLFISHKVNKSFISREEKKKVCLKNERFRLFRIEKKGE